MRRFLAVLGALFALVAVTAGVIITADGIHGLTATRLGETRTPVPGKRSIHLESRKYVLFFELAEASLPDDPDGSTGDLRVPALDLTIRRGGDGSPLALHRYGSDLQVSSGGRAARAFATVRVPRAGTYEIRVHSRADGSAPAVVLGRPVAGRVLRLVLGILLLVTGLATAALVAGIAVAGALRRERAG